MRTGEPRRLAGPNKSPGRIFENLIIVGSNTGEGYGSPPGDLRAYDVVTGRLVWTFHTIPRPGEFGYDTWPPDAWKYAGGANTWGDITIDAKNGIVFVPTGSPTHDLYGADRAGDNLFGNCLLALDARTGKRLWHFQTVHHDLWDYDLAAAPKLLTVRHERQAGRHRRAGGQDGIPLRVRAADRKAALANRGAGRAEERRAGRSLVSRRSRFRRSRAPFARQVFTPDDVNPFMSAEEQEKLRQAVRETRSQRPVHAVEPSAPSHSVSGRVGRRELGKRGGRSRDRHALRAQPGDAELSPDGAQHGASGTAADQRRPA